MADKNILIHHLLEQSARIFPGKTALIHENIRATYEQINNEANHLAHRLIEMGITNGARVALVLENCLEYVVSYYGVLKAGAVVAPLNIGLKPDKLLPILKNLDPQAIISSTRFEKMFKEIDLNSIDLRALIIRAPKKKWECSGPEFVPWEELSASREISNPGIKIEPEALASVIYTSGSTGDPKGVMLSHGSIVSNVNAICRYLHLTEKDIQMVILPFFYVMGKSLLNTHVAVGGTVVLNNKFAFPTTVIKQMVKEKVTGFSGVPSTFAYLLYHSSMAKYREKLSSLRYCSQAGGHMSKRIKRDLRNMLPDHTEIYIMYGATEASARLTYLEPADYDLKMGSIGKPLPGVSLSILDKKGKKAAKGQIGDLFVSGPNIMKGYWRDIEATEKVLSQNVYYTGDLAYQDEDGYFYLAGRKDNLLKVGGHRINPQEVEEVMMGTGLVIEAAVLGVPDKLLGHKLIALANPKNDNTSEIQILSSCARKLPKFKLPSAIKMIRSLPKNASGKTDLDSCYELAVR